MSNVLNESPIQLGGSGFVAKKNGNFLPGEYKKLCNMEIDNDGALVNRRNIYSVYGKETGGAGDMVAGYHRFLGHMGEYTLYCDKTFQYLIGESTYQRLWYVLPFGPVGGASYSSFLGFFRYNNKNYWIVFEFEAGVRVSVVLYHATVPTLDVPATYAAGYEASLTRTVILNFVTGTSDFDQFQFKNFFIYKERLWIATASGLYFSKATDPLVFSVPDGGFFKHPGNTINWAFPVKDLIYTLCEDSVYALTYNINPNTDATETPLSTTIGGEMGCSHVDTPYFINNLGIFAIRGNNIDRVMDNNFDYGSDVYSNRLISFENYLVVNKFKNINYNRNYANPNQVDARRNLWPNPESDTVGGSQIKNNWTVASDPNGLNTINPIDAVDETGYGVNTTPGKVLKLSGTIPDADLVSFTPGDAWGSCTYSINPATALVPDIPYTFRFEYKPVGPWVKGKLVLFIEYYDSTLGITKGLNTLVVSEECKPTNSFAVYTVDNLRIPTGTNRLIFTLRFILDPVSSGPIPWEVQFNRFHFEKSVTFSGYLSGASTDTVDTTYSWAGAAYGSESFTSATSTHGYLRHNGPVFDPFEGGNTLGYNTYFINTDNGSTHIVDFTDRTGVIVDTPYGEYSRGGCGFVVDMVVNPYKDSSGNYRMFLMVSMLGFENEDRVDYYSFPYIMRSSREDTEVCDYLINNYNLTIERRPPKVDIVIESYAPDDTEYKVKKFRSLLLEGIFPRTRGVEVQVGYDNNALSSPMLVSDDERYLTEKRRGYPHRIGLNQRARSITVRISNSSWLYALTESWGPLSIFDIRTLWTPTQKLPHKRSV